MPEALAGQKGLQFARLACPRWISGTRELTRRCTRCTHGSAASQSVSLRGRTTLVDNDLVPRCNARFLL